jgi:WhiB family redox-sensing transcriptional regulator
MSHGNCFDTHPAVFFPETRAGLILPISICKECPVRTTCLEYALSHGIKEGVWGGVSERGRRRILKERREAAA